jgi:uncharacterized protein YbjT (DUF2867 family)
MNILLFGATGMVGDGVLRWLIASARVDRVVAVSRKALRGGAPLPGSGHRCEEKRVWRVLSFH